MNQLHALTKQEIPAFAALWHAGWREAHMAHVSPELTALRTLDNFSSRLMSLTNSTFVAKDDAGPLGLVIVTPEEINQLYSAPRARGTGLAAQLIDHGETVLAEQGTTRAHLFVIEQNARARAFYEKRGWENCGSRVEEIPTSAGQFSLTVLRYEKTLMPHS